MRLLHRSAYPGELAQSGGAPAGLAASAPGAGALLLHDRPRPPHAAPARRDRSPAVRPAARATGLTAMVRSQRVVGALGALGSARGGGLGVLAQRGARVAASGSKSTGSGGTDGALEVTGSNCPLCTESEAAIITSSTCWARCPLERGVPPVRIARAISSTPSPRPWVAPSAGISTQSSAPAGQSRIVPSNWFGSGKAIVASVPVIATNPARGEGESKLNTLWAEAPDSNCNSAPTWVGTSTSNVVPARGPEPMVRVRRAVEPEAATCPTAPKVCTSVVRQ